MERVRGTELGKDSERGKRKAAPPFIPQERRDGAEMRKAKPQERATPHGGVRRDHRRVHAAGNRYFTARFLPLTVTHV